MQPNETTSPAPGTSAGREEAASPLSAEHERLFKRLDDAHLNIRRHPEAFHACVELAEATKAIRSALAAERAAGERLREAWTREQEIGRRLADQLVAADVPRGVVRCTSFAPSGKRCVFIAAHEGKHYASPKETWTDAAARAATTEST